MKKFVLLSLVLIIGAFCFTSVFANAEFSATDQTMFIYPNDDNGYFFARVENTGDAGGYTGSGTLDILDENDEIIVTKSYVSTNPYSIWLEPGEYTYVNLYLWEKSFLEKNVTDYNYSIPVGNWGDKYEKIPCDAEYYFDGKNPYDNAVFVTFTNKSDQLLHDYEVVVALYDAEGYLIYSDDTSNSSIAIHPGSTVTVQISIDSSLVKYLDEQGIAPAKVEALTFVEIQ